MDLLSGHLDVFSGTFPSSGSMRNGQVFVRRMSGLRIADSDSSLLPTTRASDGTSGPWPSRKAHGFDLRTVVRFLGTPQARDWKDGRYVAKVPLNGLLPRMVWSIGESTGPPSDSGSTSLDDQLPFPLSTDD